MLMLALIRESNAAGSLSVASFRAHSPKRNDWIIPFGRHQQLPAQKSLVQLGHPAAPSARDPFPLRLRLVSSSHPLGPPECKRQ